MVVNKGTNLPGRKQDFVYVAILSAIAAGIGVYLIATTVLIAKDGVFYIERAQRFSSDPIGIIKAHPPGYPFLIFVAHKLVSFFSDNSSVYTWIYSAQGVTLLCKMLSLIPLYFIGKILVGPRSTFLALLVLIFLPYPTEFGSDALRDWPHVLFLACGYLAILWGIKKHNWWIFGIAGLSSGFGYIIRHMSLQLIVCAIVCLGYYSFRPVKTFSRGKAILATILLIAGFLIPAGPYMVVKGKMLPDKLYPIIHFLTMKNHTRGIKIRTYSITPKSDVSNTKHIVCSDYETSSNVSGNEVSVEYAAASNNKAFEAIGLLVEKFGENLMWFFVLPLVIGLYYHLRVIAAREEKILLTTLILLNIVLPFSRYCFVSSEVSRRYVMPLVVFTVFFIPTGLKLLSCWILGASQKYKLKAAITSDEIQKLFYTLLIIGLCICVPKLLRPIRVEKHGYRVAAKWLRGNTAQEDVIAVPDKRLYFYAHRDGFVYEDGEDATQANYIVKIVKSENEELSLGRAVRKEHSVWVNEQKKRRKLMIYKLINEK